MHNSTIAAWGVPCSAAEIGAQAQTYVESKSTITAFRICIRDGQIQGAPVGRLPEELINAIVKLFRGSALQRIGQKWRKRIACCESKCRPLDHYTGKEKQKLRAEPRYSGLNDDEELNETLDATCAYYERHFDQRQRFLSEFLGESCYGRHSGGWFGKYNKVLSKDFGLELVFAAFLDEDNEEATSVLAHLITPSHHARGRTCVYEGGFSALSTMILDPGVLQPFSVELKERFRLAMKILNLKPFLHQLHPERSFPTNVPLSSIAPDQLVMSKEQETEMIESEWPKLIVVATVEGYWD